MIIVLVQFIVIHGLSSRIILWSSIVWIVLIFSYKRVTLCEKNDGECKLLYSQRIRSNVATVVFCLVEPDVFPKSLVNRHLLRERRRPSWL